LGLILWSKSICIQPDTKRAITRIIYVEIEIIYTNFDFCFKPFRILTVSAFSGSYETPHLFYEVIFSFISVNVPARFLKNTVDNI